AKKVNELTKPISAYGIKFGAFETGKSNYADRMITRDEYKKSLQKQCWSRIFSDMNMEKYVTKGVNETINKFVEQQVHVPFTMRNVYKMIQLIVGTHGNRMNNVIIEAFENICSYAWKENCTGGEHWRTNSDYMVNKRFIIPCLCEYDTRWASEHVKVRYNSYVRMDDVVKALCYVTGTRYDDYTALRTFADDAKMEWGKWYEWGFFRIRGYKKGTMHFEFTDEKVWMQFNVKVAEAKGWRLPTARKTAKKARKSENGVDVWSK
ncbi:MAG: DUF4942 domain-containing protein, partial [Bacteroidales bacterium]